MEYGSRPIRGALVLALVICVALCLAPAVAGAAGGDTTRVSVSSSGAQPDNGCWYASASAEGRYVAFTSSATNLVAGDTNAKRDVFVRDRATGATSRVSVGSGGVEANEGSDDARISADGRFVVFDSKASNLVANDTNGVTDVFVHDRTTGVTTRESVGAAGAQASGTSEWPDISGDGRYVVFESTAADLVANDTKGHRDIFVRDRVAGTTTRVSVRTIEWSGVLLDLEASAASYKPSISQDGHYVAFYSGADGLVANDDNSATDVFVRDIVNRTPASTTRVSVASGGVESNAGGGSSHPRLSADGRFVAFESVATNFVTGDTNAKRDIFVRDRTAGVTTRVSVGSGGAQSGGDSYQPAVSGDGRLVAFESAAAGIVAGDSNGKTDVFVYDRTAGTVTPRERRAPPGFRAPPTA